MNIRTTFLALITILLTALGASAQETQSRHAVPGQRYLKEYWGRSDLYLQHQAFYMLDLADKALDANPPALKIGREREMAMLMLDAVRRYSPKVFDVAACVLLASAAALFVMFYPLESGLPCARAYAQHLRWFKWYNY